MNIISLNYLTGQIKKVVYVFYSNGNSFNMMIFITIIQPKDFRSEEYVSIVFYFKLFFTSKYLLSEHNSKKQLHIFS